MKTFKGRRILLLTREQIKSGNPMTLSQRSKKSSFKKF